MSEFFLELFSEEIPANLQKNARNNLLEIFKDFFKKKNISFNNEFSFSTPNRLLILFEGIQTKIYQKEEEIRGPKIDSPEKALSGFLRSNNLQDKDLYKKENEKGIFYFAKKSPKTIKVSDLLNENIPLILDKISWKKSMKWGDFELYWGRPLKSILAVFINKRINRFHIIFKSQNSSTGNSIINYITRNSFTKMKFIAYSDFSRWLYHCFP